MCQNHSRGWLLRRGVQAVQSGGVQQHHPVHHGHHQSNGPVEDRFWGCCTRGKLVTSSVTIGIVLQWLRLLYVRAGRCTPAVHPGKLSGGRFDVCRADCRHSEVVERRRSSGMLRSITRVSAEWLCCIVRTVLHTNIHSLTHHQLFETSRYFGRDLYSKPHVMTN